MTKLIPRALFLLALFTPAANGQSPAPTQSAKTCIADFDALEAKVRGDYAGFQDKVTGPGREAELDAFTGRVRGEVQAAADSAACTAALRRWTGFFRDRHLAVSETRPQPAAPSKEEKKPAAAPAVDDGAPALRFYEDGTAVLRLPDFGHRYKEPIDKLIADNRARLLATPYLVIDVRGNGGGWTSAYDAVLPLLYTDPVFRDGMDVWASPGNIVSAREIASSDKVPAAIRNQARELVARMEKSPGQFVTMVEDGELRLDAVLPMPRAVIVLVDRRCASTCEQFLLDARQSRKVKVLGDRSTGGLLDYGNALTTPLPSGHRRMQVPTTRSRRLPLIALDLAGVMPDVRLPRNEPDPVEFARRYLKAAPAAPTPQPK
ncbi:MAG TPA: S41 family peptidase [Pyrinomonadaceae bacterium]|nr:S41 family peptidase [Pyrinomonadaceae bacterium]